MIRRCSLIPANVTTLSLVNCAAKLLFLPRLPGVVKYLKYNASALCRAQMEYPLFTFIGRLSEQKGIDILLEVMAVFLEKNDHCQMLVLGSGNSSFESQLIAQTENARFCMAECAFCRDLVRIWPIEYLLPAIFLLFRHDTNPAA